MCGDPDDAVVVVVVWETVVPDELFKFSWELNVFADGEDRVFTSNSFVTISLSDNKVKRFCCKEVVSLSY